MGEHKRTISGAASTAVGIGGVATICHCNFVLLIDMAAPHTLRIHTSVGATTESAPQARLLTLGPWFASPFLEVLFLGRAPASGRFELSRVGNSICAGVRRRNKVLWVQEPVFVVRHDGVSETLGIFLGVGEICERRVEEDCVWVCGCGVHGVHNMG